jgi:hypothetical protein
VTAYLILVIVDSYPPPPGYTQASAQLLPSALKVSLYYPGEPCSPAQIV